MNVRIAISCFLVFVGVKRRFMKFAGASQPKYRYARNRIAFRLIRIRIGKGNRMSCALFVFYYRVYSWLVVFVLVFALYDASVCTQMQPKKRLQNFLMRSASWHTAPNFLFLC